MRPIRLLVATPSSILRSRLIKALSQHPLLQVISSAVDLSETYTLAEAMEPQVVLVAREFTAVPEWEGMRSLFYALNARWLAIVPEPAVPASADRNDPPAIHTGMSPEAMYAQVSLALSVGRAAQGAPSPAQAGAQRFRPDRIVLIGASTGGVDALLTVLSAFPANCPPTAVVQHTGRSFSESLIRLLDRRSKATVLPAAHGLVLRPGIICIAAGCDAHLRLSASQSLRCTLTAGTPVSGHMPSVDELFRSALPLADRVVAALLTGMGRDGAAGLLDLRRAGATTLAQDEESSVVYGMPGAAWELGAVQQRLPLPRIGAEILRACAQPAVRPGAAR